MNSSASRTILIVDDDQTLRRVLEECFEDSGWIVETGKDIPDLIRARDENISILLTDVLMPAGNALDHLEKLRSRRPELPILVMSAHNNLSTAMQAAEAGAFDYMAKPFDLDAIVELVESAYTATIRTHSTGSAPSNKTSEQAFGLIGRSKVMQQLYRNMARVSQTELTVLITGESGTGKELVARAIHNAGKRASKPFVAINMAAIPRDLIESELFGHEKGAFTGATAKKMGRFAEAQGGTLFLDEIGDMPLDAQTRLLRVLQEGDYRSVGAATGRLADVRILAATNSDLNTAVREGRFREDLYWRLNVIHHSLPPLRARKEDIPDLVHHFLAEAVATGLPAKTISKSAMEMLVEHGWPGNIRELKNTITQMIVLRSESDLDDVSVSAVMDSAKPSANIVEVGSNLADAVEIHLRQYFDGHAGSLPPSGLHPRIIKIVERPLLELALQATNGNQIKAADLLGLNRNTLRKKVQEHGLVIQKR